MPAEFGFVYVLDNPSMPGIYKVGCTERSPRERAAELSRPTSVPEPFRLLCYIECRDFQGVERKLHALMEDRRVSAGREFFRVDIRWLVSVLYHHPSRLSFCDATEEHLDCTPDQTTQLWCTSSDLIELIGEYEGPSALPNPWDARPRWSAKPKLAIVRSDDDEPAERAG